MPLANSMNIPLDQPLTQVRRSLRNLPEQQWIEALGINGVVYKKIWHLLEGVEINN